MLRGVPLLSVNIFQDLTVKFPKNLMAHNSSNTFPLN